MYEEADRFFDLPKDHYPSRFMLYVCPVTGKTRKESILPAVTHVDGYDLQFKKDSSVWDMLDP